MSSLSRGTKEEIFSILPPGTVLPFAGTIAPAGWALCDGSIISRSEYPELYNVIGDTWGNGDGSTTFHLPDLRGRFLRGTDNGAGRDANAGTRAASNSGGATGDNVGTIQGDAIRDITGSASFHGVSTSAGNNMSGAMRSTATGNGYTWNNSVYYGTNWTFQASRVVPTASENRPNNININYIIKI